MIPRMIVYTEIYGYNVSNYVIAVFAVFLIGALIKTRKLSYVTCAFVFCTYLFFLVHRAFFPIHIDGGFADNMRTIPFMSGVNLIPFNFGHSSEISSVIQEMLFNIALTMPFGFGINFIAPFKSNKGLWLAPVVGVSIEAIQLVISLLIGYPYRVIDINDVIMNTLGYLIGYGVFRLFAWLYIAMTHRFNIGHVGLGKYVYAVAARATTYHGLENKSHYKQSVDANSG